MDRAFRARIAPAIAPISHRHYRLQRCIDWAGDDRFTRTRDSHCSTWLRHSGQRIRLGAPRLAARHNSGFAHPRPTFSAAAGGNAITKDGVVLPYVVYV